METITQSQWNAALEKVVLRAQNEPTFRELCLRDPRQALRDYLPTELPADFRFDFIDGRGADMTVVLPPLVDSSDELSHEDLEQMAGGIGCVFSCGTSCIATCICISFPTLTGI